MHRTPAGRIRRLGRAGAPLAGAVLLAVGLLACGGGGADEEPVLSAGASQGRQLAIAKGCASCHVFYGKDAAGPTWKGLFGSEVTLEDDTTVIADEAYLTRSIKDPWAEKVKGFATIMPRNSLSDEEIALIVGYIKELNPSGTATSGDAE
ncbi:MAG: cytochrome c [Acidimicrobiales bacterium]|nr:cytochrome c [Acidimicrobiales bacterium]